MPFWPFWPLLLVQRFTPSCLLDATSAITGRLCRLLFFSIAGILIATAEAIRQRMHADCSDEVAGRMFPSPTTMEQSQLHGPGSIQAAFQDFLKRRAQSGKRKKNQAAEPRTADAKQELRALFVSTARKYIGVPYARKHHDPHDCACEGCSELGKQLYHEPLFLDCCGLVRRVVRDLQHELGFRLGPGNQSYQFDVLPERVESVSQLQPGDLIFYSGETAQPDSKRYAFDMTHVEIFVGGSTGEATAGSRERCKWVMEYPSYRFDSQRWKLKQHYFCSIDPWLRGVCRPQHPELWPQHQQQLAAAAAAAAAGPGAGQLPPLAPGGLTWDGGRFSIFGRQANDGDGDGGGQEPGDESDGGG